MSIPATLFLAVLLSSGPDLQNRRPVPEPWMPDARCTLLRDAATIDAGMRWSATNEEVEAAEEALFEHGRLHGWQPGPDFRTSLPCVRSRGCSPECLELLHAVARSGDGCPRRGIYCPLAGVFERNGRIELARWFLTEALAAEPSSFAWDNLASMELRAGNWHFALAAVEHCTPDTDCGTFSNWQREAWARLRARCWMELGEPDRAEDLLRGNTYPGVCGECEFFVEAWSRGLGSGSIERIEARQVERSAREGPDRRWEGAGTLEVRTQRARNLQQAADHIQVLKLPPRAILDDICGEMRLATHYPAGEVLAPLMELGPEMIDVLLQRLCELESGRPAGTRNNVDWLLDVVADTGDPRVEPVLRARMEAEPPNEHSRATRRWERWQEIAAVLAELRR